MARSTDEIRQSIEQARRELAGSLVELQAKTNELADWRLQFNRHRRAALVGALAAGFVLGGGVAALATWLAGRR
ncbi:DUF3618 domain-containing protein [Thermoleophilum album]|jgi:hypothetical protein|uniref:DUF3618 domain-containing protein n=1 Tax=Thermoleophilum album TaxID=29539 RepID=UPI000CB69765|nr:DUF3618 domain-containing protein [Thermoleophilum album]MCL6441149.1 DUF3618 domain-containing protein [Thermoleophilum sp.]WDT93385.1 DUF3618 domain-containing protein [Thermoleophilum album]GBD45311.1 hypothetical protein HRbin41_00111 [bacterium HR41]